MHSSGGAINASLQHPEPRHVLPNVADPSPISSTSMKRTVPSSPSTTPAVAAGQAIDPCVPYNLAPFRLASTSADVLVCLIMDAPAIKARSAGVGNPPHTALRARSASADNRHPDDRPSFSA
ncbi:unnamed protein product [Tilletia controversa]|uniref:Uncharacterized protein n=3 Tax=Tilletia TaxID=13289 RepID=A0A8X7MVH0_9BASI|nr:hypothetical protein CF336_g6862 [Tilletia laevis]KAE8188462.1 hypothetical protein CF328_g6591 [Tilletia controversa]KAE8251379.1 hypothetical protein A4X03_0g6377 [Tilletia caries]KAE8188971.1 hypothetical protein CF335_g6745 [Tilletia laevis]KAE8248554.1 hypothetical protein A4X06_0g3628 [Tilletia controversa]